MLHHCQVLGDFYVLGWEPQFGEELDDGIPMVSLENNLVVFGRAPAGAEGLQLLREMAQVKTLLVNALDDGDGPPPLPRLLINSYALLLLTDGSTDTDVRGKSALRSDLCHLPFL